MRRKDPLHRSSAWCALVVLALSCNDDGETRSLRPDDGDHASNGIISIDERALTGSLTDGELELAIAVRAIGATATQGSLVVALQKLPATTVERVQIGYRIAAGKRVTLHAKLPMAEVDDQADLVRYNVRVEQKGLHPLRVTRSLLYVLPIYALRLEGPKQLRTDKRASYRAVVEDPRTHAALEGQDVELTVQRDDEAVESLTAETDERGVARFDLQLADAGDYEVQASVAKQAGKVTLSQGIEVEPAGSKVLLTTDKPIYQPGQTIHMRVLALESPSNKPLADQEIVLEVQDGKGNKIMKRTLQTEAHGIASSDFKLGNFLNMGSFKLSAIAGAVTAEKSVEVSRYALPKFDLTVSVDKPWYRPGDLVHGTVEARYFFGKNVSGGDVVIEGSTLDVNETVFARVMGKTDSEGSMDFELDLPDAFAGIPLQDGNALVTVRAKVTDAAGQEVQKERALTVARQGVQLSLVPEATAVVPGIENRFHLFASDPLGLPIVDAEAEVTPKGGATATGKTDGFGHLLLRWTPASAEEAQVTVVLRPDGVPALMQAFDFADQSGDEHVLVRTDKSIYQLGDDVQVQVFGTDSDGVAYVDWLNEGQAVDVRTIQLKNGSATFTTTADVTLLGDNRIEAYVVDAAGNIVRAGRSIVVKNDTALSVSLAADRSQYQPGDPAQLTFSVVDEAGEPAVAALGVQIVDEAVYGLVDARPGLLKTYFELQDAFARPQYEIQGPAVGFEQLLFEDTGPGADPDVAEAAQARAEGALAALTVPGMTGVHLSSWPATLKAAHEQLVPLLDKERVRLNAIATPIVQAALDDLLALGCMPDEYYCEEAQLDLPSALIERSKGKLHVSDFWGTAYRDETADYGEVARLRSAGPDERLNTEDDELIAVLLDDLRLQVSGSTADAGVDECPACHGGGHWPPEAGDGGQGGSASAAGSGGSGGSDEPSEGPRVRREFPETLYVNPALITDEDGKATISLDMADSITTWRVSALANSLDGKLGGGQSGITVFQDFFVDVSFPAELTRGDEVEFPVVVYNYLQDAQSVQLSLQAEEWYTALGDTELAVDLAPGEVRAVRFPVRVEQVGNQTLTVKAIGGDAADAVARSVRVVPDGQPVPVAQSGSLGEGSTTLSVSYPSEAIAGSLQLTLDVFPAFLAQAVQGLDSLLQVPSGCFEQTTSTAWPNVLVTRYMQETGQTTPEIALKAESLISAGYQRLLTFEHEGGGYSWFGEQDPAPFLSVTAFGLMEFADMAGVSEVDPAMIARTQSWLLSQQRDDGAWQGDMSEFFSFQTSVVRNTAFVVWALAQNGYDGAEITRGLQYVKDNLGSEEGDGYTLALAANAFAFAAPSDSFGSELLSELDDAKIVDDDKVHWDSEGTHTNFYGAGDDAAVSTTALVAHAMLSAGGYPGTVNGALSYLTAAKDAQGNFGSTQATIWTLKTLLLSALKGTEGAVGTLDVQLDGAPFASVPLTEAQSDVMTTVDMSALASTGDHSVKLGFSGSGKVSYNLVSTHHVPWAAQPGEPKGTLSITLDYDRTNLVVDETVTATVAVKNETASDQSMILVTLGIPPGFDLLGEDLDVYVDSHALSHFEHTGRQLDLYLSELPASAERSFSYRLRATMPVRAADGGGEARPYYEPTQRAQALSTSLVVTER